MPRQALSGFTLIELMITIAVLGVLAAIAAPSFKSLLEQRQLNGAADNLYADLQFARSQAIKSNEPVLFQVTNSADGWCYGIHDDPINGCDCSANECSVDGQKRNITQNNYRNIKLTTGEAIEFEPRQGMPSQTESYTLQIGSSTRQKVIKLNVVGRIEVN